MTERRKGHSKIVWDKATQTMTTVDPYPRDTSLDHRSLDWAVDIIGMCEPIRCIQGGMWFGHNHNFADAAFVDYGAADAFAVAAKALPVLVKALQSLADNPFCDPDAVVEFARKALHDAVGGASRQGERS